MPQKTSKVSWTTWTKHENGPIGGEVTSIPIGQSFHFAWVIWLMKKSCLVEYPYGSLDHWSKPLSHSRYGPDSLEGRCEGVVFDAQICSAMIPYNVSDTNDQKKKKISKSFPEGSDPKNRLLLTEGLYTYVVTSPAGPWGFPQHQLCTVSFCLQKCCSILFRLVCVSEIWIISHLWEFFIIILHWLSAEENQWFWLP